jgi:ankyrin repeat protein
MYAIERGAHVDVHAAARLGLLDRLEELVVADPELVHARGGDGQLPLHFAADEQIAAFLLDSGADIDARDIDHESTAAQWMLGERQETARFLVSRGCWTDLLMAATLGDLGLAREHLARDPDSIRMRVSPEYFHMVGGGKSGGTIYQWVLGWYVSPHQVAKSKGHLEVYDYFNRHSPPAVRLLNAAWLHDGASVDSLLDRHPDIGREFTPADLGQLAHAARNNDLAALELFLRIGLPVESRSQHGATPLHWMAWHGNPQAVRLILEREPPLEDDRNDFGARRTAGTGARATTQPPSSFSSVQGRSPLIRPAAHPPSRWS